MPYFVSYFCNHLEGEVKAGCLDFIILQMFVTVNVLWLFLRVPWVGVQYVIVVFPNHTHLLFIIYLVAQKTISDHFLDIGLLSAHN